MQISPWVFHSIKTKSKGKTHFILKTYPVKLASFAQYLERAWVHTSPDCVSNADLWALIQRAGDSLVSLSALLEALFLCWRYWEARTGTDSNADLFVFTTSGYSWVWGDLENSITRRINTKTGRRTVRRCVLLSPPTCFLWEWGIISEMRASDDRERYSGTDGKEDKMNGGEWGWWIVTYSVGVLPPIDLTPKPDFNSVFYKIC